ncbi:MAG: EAL domain-containing protein, partial [Bacteroidetes bacterium]|nr:EAL domain-containing protein [Bacteroidota bacterium]
VYQPLVDIDQGQVAGAEALLRWQHPIHGIISPHITVALAEDTDLISKLGMQLLSKACCYQKVLLENGQKPSIISVNMSASQFEDDDLVENVFTILKDTGIPPQSLKIEITESIALTPEARPVSALIRLRELGVRVAIDDFGMGHTSLRYLKEFPIDTVKIDRSLTQESADGVGDHIVNSIVNLCEALNVQIIVEGVETIDHIERFKKYHCHLFQGYFFSKPLSGKAYFKYFWGTGEDDIQSKLKRRIGRIDTLFTQVPQ